MREGSRTDWEFVVKWIFSLEFYLNAFLYSELHFIILLVVLHLKNMVYEVTRKSEP